MNIQHIWIWIFAKSDFSLYYSYNRLKLLCKQ